MTLVQILSIPFLLCLVVILGVSIYGCYLDHGFFATFFVLSLVLLIIAFFINSAQAETYKYKNGLAIEATDYKKASHKCFNILTNGKYPGEELGLNIIDLCTNPTKGKIN